MKEGFKFVFVTNCSPMGDCKQFDTKFYNALKNTAVFDLKHDDLEAKTDIVKKPNKKQTGHSFPFDPVDCGKVIPSSCIMN